MEKLGKKIRLFKKISLHEINTLTVYAFNLESYIFNLPVIFENKRKQLEKELKELNEFINSINPKNEDNISDGSTN